MIIKDLIMKKIIFLSFISISLFGSKTLSTKAQQGPMSLKENFTLANNYPEPSAWLLANACSGCHGTDGSEMDNNIPPIVGIDKATFVEMMKAYKTQKPSKPTVMTIVAEPLTGKEINLMADYFSKLKAKEWSKPNWNKDVVAPSWAKGDKDAKK